MVSNINVNRFSKSCWDKCAAEMTSRDLIPMLVCGGNGMVLFLTARRS